MAIVIKSEKEITFLQANGHQYVEGFTPAFDTDRQLKGVVKDRTGEFKATFPLNGWRARNLAEDVLGERDASLWTIGKAMAVPVKSLQNLPGFDQKYYDLLESMTSLNILFTIIEVVEIDPGYGCHIISSCGIKNSVV